MDYNAGPDACGCCHAISSPIVVPLRGDDVRLSSALSGVPFDFFGTGLRTLYAWPVDADDAWLVLDRNHNGQVDDASELFGNRSPLRSGETARNGYELLADLDENHDGLVDARDSAFSGILFWRDVARNGVVDPARHELVTATDVGVVAFETAYHESRRIDRWGNEFRYRGVVVFSRPPYRRHSWDVYLTSARPTS